MRSLRRALFFLILSSFYGVTLATQAVSVRPLFFDYKAKPRDDIHNLVTLTNNFNRKLTVYVIVNNLSDQEGPMKFIGPAQADNSTSLANWITINRGVIEILPGQRKTIDFSIKVSPFAKPGIYHAVIAFVDAATRDDAENKASVAPNSIINLEVLDTAQEKLKLEKFGPASSLIFALPTQFYYELDNSGDKPVTPRGDLIIYNRRGEEMASFDLNEGNNSIEPGNKKELAVVIDQFRGWGRYKATINLDYGANVRQSLQDTTFFWIIPWPKLLAIFSLLLAAAVGATFCIQRYLL